MKTRTWVFVPWRIHVLRHDINHLLIVTFSKSKNSGNVVVHLRSKSFRQANSIHNPWKKRIRSFRWYRLIHGMWDWNSQFAAIDLMCLRFVSRCSSIPPPDPAHPHVPHNVHMEIFVKWPIRSRSANRMLLFIRITRPTFPVLYLILHNSQGMK